MMNSIFKAKSRARIHMFIVVASLSRPENFPFARHSAYAKIILSLNFAGAGTDSHVLSLVALILKLSVEVGFRPVGNIRN